MLPDMHEDAISARKKTVHMILCTKRAGRQADFDLNAVFPLILLMYKTIIGRDISKKKHIMYAFCKNRSSHYAYAWYNPGLHQQKKSLICT